MNKTAAFTLAAAVLAAAFGVQAQTAETPRIDQRQARQEKRIDQGVASGQLTPRETRRLERHQAAIDQAENRAKADGTVTAQERRRLAHAQKHESRRIHRQKHDAQQRPASAPQ